LSFQNFLPASEYIDKSVFNTSSKNFLSSSVKILNNLPYSSVGSLKDIDAPINKLVSPFSLNKVFGDFSIKLARAGYFND